MQKDRLTALTDGVIAVIITIMVLELKPPHGVDLAALAASWPVFLSYVLSFVYVAIFWNNHHHFFQVVDQVDGAILWANMHLLFWLSLVPFATAWMGEHPTAAVPTALYGASLLMSAVAWFVMQAVIIHAQGPDSAMKRALGRDLKSRASVAFYLCGAGLAFVAVWAADLAYAGVALLWLIPDKRMAAAIAAD